MKKTYKEWMLNPWIIFLSMFVGVAIGLINKNLAIQLAPLGSIYLGLLQMCVLPIIITAVVVSLGNMLHSGTAGIYLKRLLVVFGAGLLGAAILALVMASLFSPGTSIRPADKLTLSQHIANIEVTAHAGMQVTVPPPGLVAFLGSIVPHNIFYALSNGQALSVLFFCVLLGTALGLVRSEGAKTVLVMLEAIYSAFLKIISWIMLLLPLGLCFLFAGYISQIGWAVLLALGKLIILLIGTALLMMSIYSVILWRKLKIPFLQLLQAMKAPLIVAFSTSSSFATLPTTLKTLQEDLKLDGYITRLVIPLGINFNQQAAVLRYVMVAVFMVQLYGHPLNASEIAFTIVTSVAAAVAVSGIPGIAGINIFALVLAPLNLPLAIGTILLTAIEPVIDPFITMVNVYGNCTAAAIIAKREVEEVTSVELVPD